MDLIPALLWRFFEDLCRIPRGSGNESGVRAYVERLAAERKWSVAGDRAGNCLVSVPGRGAGLRSERVIIQSHMDMVCVADGEHGDHDFTRDPIRTRLARWTESGAVRDVVMGTGTTLGADNGIGLAAGLAVATDPDVADCPPLDLLFTVDEETGLTGARLLDPALLRSDLLINLDTEELGDICVSCAGGRDLMAEWKVNRGERSSQTVLVRTFVQGLPGGHSGVQIHERRGNAIKMLIGKLLTIPEAAGSVEIVSLDGGAARNVIPGRMTATFRAPERQATAIERAFNDAAFRQAILEDADEDVAGSVSCGAERIADTGEFAPIPAALSSAILNAIAAIPNGVQAWSEVVEGLVETSNNVAVLRTEESSIHLQCSTRSSREGAIEAFQETVRPELEASGALITFGEGYPGWPADPNNPLLRQAELTFKAALGYPPRVSAVHAGLECGVLKGKRPSLQMISFGPDIAGAHTTNERVAVDSVPPFYACLTGLLRDLCR